MPSTASSTIVSSRGFEDALDSIVEAERNRLILTAVAVAPMTLIIAFIVPSLTLIPIALLLAMLAVHGLTRYRVANGLYGTNKAEMSEIVEHVMALHRPCDRAPTRQTV